MRCFVAIDIPPEARDRLVAVQEALRGVGADVRWVRPETLHLTLRFLGDVDAPAAASLGTALAAEAARRPPLPLALHGTGLFPTVVWAGCRGDLAPLAAAVDAIATSLGLPADDKPFAAHVTIGRVKSGRHAALLRAALPEGPIAAFEAREMALMRSTLKPTGPVYERLGTFPFTSGR
jgi:2'-5' RNA ligase